MPVKENDFLIIEGTKKIKYPIQILKNKSINFGKYQINLSDFINLEFFIPYTVKEGKIIKFIVEKKEIKELSDWTINKYALKKGIRKEKPFTLLPLNPLNFHKFLNSKREKIYSLSIFSYLSLFINRTFKCAIYDQQNCLLSFTALYKNLGEKGHEDENVKIVPPPDFNFDDLTDLDKQILLELEEEKENVILFGNKRTKKRIGPIIINHKIFDNEEEYFADNLIIVEQLNLEKIKELILAVNFWNKLVIYQRYRDDAEKVFNFLFPKKENMINSDNKFRFVDVHMYDFMARSFLIESFHPIINGDWNEGYVIVGTRIQE